MKNIELEEDRILLSCDMLEKGNNTYKIYYNDFGTRELTLLIQFLNEPKCLELSSLDLEISKLKLNSIPQGDLPDLLANFRKSLKNKKGLTTFKLINDIDCYSERLDFFIEAICNGLTNNFLLTEIKFSKIVSDPGARLISLLVKTLPGLNTLDLNHNQIGDEAALLLINAFVETRNLGNIRLDNNLITEKYTNFIMNLTGAFNISIVNLRPENILNISTYKKSSLHKEKFYLNKIPYKEAAFSHYDHKKLLLKMAANIYIDHKPGCESEFIEQPTGKLSLKQFLKPMESRIWEKLPEEKSVIFSKKILLCAWSMIFGDHKFFNKYFLNKYKINMEVYYWQGDPFHLGTEFSRENFVPALAEQVQIIMESACPEKAHEYWVIDQAGWSKQFYEAPHNHRFFFGSFYFLKTVSTEANFCTFGHLIKKEQFKKIIPAISKNVEKFDFYGCDALDSADIAKSLSQFPRLQFLGLLKTRPWGFTELKMAAGSCIHLKKLKIAIDTVPPLNILPEFKHLRRLHLDLSKNHQLKNLDFLNDPIANSVFVLTFSQCENLKDLSGLKYCHNLREISFSDMQLDDFDGLITQLAQLKNLRLFLLNSCQYNLTRKQKLNIIPKIKAILPEVYFSYERGISDYYIRKIKDVDKDDRSFSTLGFLIFGKSVFEFKKDDFENKREHKVEETHITEPTSAIPEYHDLQIFWFSNGQWPDSRLDRWLVQDGIEINDEGRIVLAASSILELDLVEIKSVEQISFQNINRDLLKRYEEKNHKGQKYYAGQLEIAICQEWVRLPSRGVFSYPVACSEKLDWAQSQITGELFVRLPKKERLSNEHQNIILRYVAILVERTADRNLASNTKFPEVLKLAFKKLTTDVNLLSSFPRFYKFLNDIGKLISKKDRYRRIKQYCQVGGPEGFKDIPLEKKMTNQVREFVIEFCLENWKNLKNHNTAIDLITILNVLLQQRGACQQATLIVQMLCGMFEVPCHSVQSKTHYSPEYAYFDENKSLIAQSDDLGGGEAKVTKIPLINLDEKIVAVGGELIQFQTNQFNELWIENTLAEFKPAIPSGSECKDEKSYWQKILDCDNPLIRLKKSTDAQQFMAALVLYIEQDPLLSRKRLFYIDNSKQISHWLQAFHIADGKSQIVPGWLGQLLLCKERSILVINFSKFKSGDLLEIQGIGDKKRTLKDYPLSPELRVIGLADPELAREDIFLSRFISIEYRTDLLAEAKPIQFLWESTEDDKISNLPTRHLYADDQQAERELLGGPELLGADPSFSNGILSEDKHSIVLTDEPVSIHPLLYQVYLTEQVMINGEMKIIPLNWKIFHKPHPLPVSDLITFIREIVGEKLFYLNNYTYSLLVFGNRRIDPETGLTFPVLPILLSEEMPGTIVVTASLSYSNWLRLIDLNNLRKKPLSIYLCPGKQIFGIGEKSFAQKTGIIREFKNITRSMVIESNDPESTALSLYSQGIEADDFLTLTPEIGLELLTKIQRKDETFCLQYLPGWLLVRLRSKKTTVLIGHMSQLLYYALESIFTEQSYLYTNEGRETFSGYVVWIKPDSSSIELSSVVSNYQHRSIFKKTFETEQKKMGLTLSYQMNVDIIADFIGNDSPKADLLELVGPPGSGKTTSVSKAIEILQRDRNMKVNHFSTRENYVAWKIQNPGDEKSINILQLDDCKMFPPGHFEYLRDIRRKSAFYCQGNWYPGLKVIITNNYETDSDYEKHPIFTEFLIPQIHFSPFTPSELREYIILPPLTEIKELDEHTLTPVSQIIMAAHQYVAKYLPFACISSRELITACQRLAVLIKLSPETELLLLAARACYEEFFGLFTQEQDRKKFWEFLLHFSQITNPVNSPPILLDMTLQKQLQEQKIQITRQVMIFATMALRLLQLRERYAKSCFPGKRGLLIEGPPGILKTESLLAVLEIYGFKYLNLVTCDPDTMEKTLIQATTEHVIVVWNELNVLTELTENLLLKSLDAGLFLMATQNNTSAGSGRKPLSRRLKNRLQVIYAREYHHQELTQFTVNQNFVKEGDMIVTMFLSLRDYQIKHNLPIANPRHFFRFLAQLPSNSTPAVMLHFLLKTCCNPLLSPHKTEKINQYGAAKFILQRSNPMGLFASNIRVQTTSSTRRGNYCIVQ
jgi:hypothetical protein